MNTDEVPDPLIETKPSKPEVSRAGVYTRIVIYGFIVFLAIIALLGEQSVHSGGPGEYGDGLLLLVIFVGIVFLAIVITIGYEISRHFLNKKKQSEIS